MAISNRRSRRKISGGRYRDFRKKRLSDLERPATLTHLGSKSTSQFRIMAGRLKKILLGAEMANVYDPKSKKYQVVKIKTVLENKANRNFVRRNIITKGTIIETELGKARVTSRPGQVATLNAVLV